MHLYSHLDLSMSAYSYYIVEKIISRNYILSTTLFFMIKFIHENFLNKAIPLFYLIKSLKYRYIYTNVKALSSYNLFHIFDCINPCVE